MKRGISDSGVRELERHVENIRVLLDEMTDSQRLEAFAMIQDGYCNHCGCDDPAGRCQCWNDE